MGRFLIGVYLTAGVKQTLNKPIVLTYTRSKGCRRRLSNDNTCNTSNGNAGHFSRWLLRWAPLLLRAEHLEELRLACIAQRRYAIELADAIADGAPTPLFRQNLLLQLRGGPDALPLQEQGPEHVDGRLP